MSTRPSPASHKHGGVCAARSLRPRVGGAGARASGTCPVLVRLIPSSPSPFNGYLTCPESPAQDLAPLASNAAPRHVTPAPLTSVNAG